MFVVGSAAAADHPQVRKAVAEPSIVGAQLSEITSIEFRGFVEFGMAHARRVGPDGSDSAQPCLVAIEHVVEV